MFHVKHDTSEINLSGYPLPMEGNAVKLRICVSRYDSAIDYRLLRFLKLLRLLRFSECAYKR